MRAIFITVDLMFLLKVFIINKSKDTHHKYAHFTFLRFSLDFIPCFWPIFADFQNEAASLCVDNSINKDVK